MDRQNAVRLAEEVMKWCTSIHPNGSPAAFRVLLDIVRHGESHQNKIMERTGVSQSITAHTVLTFSKQGQKGHKHPKAILANIIDESDRRQRLVSLTPYGKSLVQDLNDRLELLLDRHTQGKE